MESIINVSLIGFDPEMFVDTTTLEKRCGGGGVKYVSM